MPISVGGLTTRIARQLFNGIPVWGLEVDGVAVPNHPGGYRSVDAESGAVKWTHPENADDVVV